VNHLDLLNAILALRFKQPGWPTIFADAGYLVHGVGVTFRLPDGTRIAPDVLASSSARNTALLIEVKGGAGFDHEQAGRMERVTAADLRDSAYLPIADPASYRVGIVYVCTSDHHAAFVAAVSDRVGTIVAFDGARFTFGGALLPDGELALAWEGVHVVAGALPLAIVPFDQESAPAMIARAVIPEVVSLWVGGAGVVPVDAVLQRTHHLVHGVMQSTGSKSEWQGLKKRVVDLLNEAARNELEPWLTRIPSQPTWAFRSALPLDSATRMREWKELQKATQLLTERLGGPQLELPLAEPDPSA
jgi:hypothetical protein